MIAACIVYTSRAPARPPIHQYLQRPSDQPVKSLTRQKSSDSDQAAPVTAPANIQPPTKQDFSYPDDLSKLGIVVQHWAEQDPKAAWQWLQSSEQLAPGSEKELQPFWLKGVTSIDWRLACEFILESGPEPVHQRSVNVLAASAADHPQLSLSSWIEYIPPELRETAVRTYTQTLTQRDPEAASRVISEYSHILFTTHTLRPILSRKLQDAPHSAGDWIAALRNPLNRQRALRILNQLQTQQNLQQAL